MRAEPRLSESEQAALFQAAASLAAVEAHRYRQRHPRAHAWTDVWCELRHAFVAVQPDGAVGCQAAIVTVTRNRRTGRLSEIVLIASDGPCPASCARDLLQRLDHHARAAGAEASFDGAFPVGMLGTHTVGQA